MRVSSEFEMGGFMAQEGPSNLAREKMLQDRGELPGEEGDIVRQRWTTRTAVGMQYLNESDCMKLEIEELELQLGPEDSEVNLRHILRTGRQDL